MAYARPASSKNEPTDLYEHIVSSMNVQNIFEEQNPISCMLCKLGISTMSFPLKISLVQDLIQNMIVNLICPTIPSISNVTMCPGLMGSMKNAIWAGVFDSFLHPDYSCEEFLGVCSSSSFSRISAED